jgi:uncharacterized repeat protein (TIGR03803 family)
MKIAIFLRRQLTGNLVPVRGLNRLTRETRSKNQLSGWRTACAVFLLCVAAAITARAQTFTVLSGFNWDNGSSPSSLVQGADGNFYGTTWSGGAHNVGTVFRVTPSGTLTTLHNFDYSDGAWPLDGLVQATDGNFYGTTLSYGTSLDLVGTIFKVTPGGHLTTLYDFCSQANCADGDWPLAGLIQATDGNFYGTTSNGGGNKWGTIFRRNAAGKITVLHDFCSQTTCSDGGQPSAQLVQGADGYFYGTTGRGGINESHCTYEEPDLPGCGTVFKMTPTGQFTTLYRFCAKMNCSDGFFPNALVQGADGNFYGTTGGGGIYDPLCGSLGCGTLFKLTPGGTLTTLYRSCAQTGCPGGYFGSHFNVNQKDALIQANDGNFYGATDAGGTSNAGTLFKVTTSGKLTTLYSFCAQSDCPDGAYTGATLTQGTDGNFYGTAYGNPGANGTVFKLSVGLSPFVSFIRVSGKVGQTAQILGQGFTGTTSVSFNGALAAFTVKSDTYLTATIPAGATTGFVSVTTPSGTLKSNKIFRVTPQILSFSPTSGPIGTSVVITGVSFTGATIVGFGGVQTRSFTVDSDTQITVTVPTGAQTGNIAVHTAGGNVQSPCTKPFTVTP